jgi:hypothetical protein
VIAVVYAVKKVEIWHGEIDDHIGGLTSCLEPLGDAGADLDVVIARRQPHVRGKGVVFVGPINGSKARQAAEAAGLRKAGDVSALHVEGPNRPGECRRLTGVLAEAGINLRGLSALAIGARFVAALAFDNAADADQAARVLRAVGAKSK